MQFFDIEIQYMLDLSIDCVKTEVKVLHDKIINDK